MASIFGPLDKRQRAATDAAFAGEAEFSFEDRADLLADILEEDETCFPLLDCPPEVLSSVLLLSEAVTAVRLRPLCCQMRSAVDSNEGLWSLLTLRDFEDLGGTTKHYRGLRTLADAWDESLAMRRLEWDPLMICAPPPLRYSLLRAMEARRQLWTRQSHSLGAGWAWFSAKVCRRMAVTTFLRWASLQHDDSALQALLRPLGLASRGNACEDGAAEPMGSGTKRKREEEDKAEGAATSCSSSQGMRFRRGRSDAVELSAEAVTDIYETVQRWHSKEHREMMRAHFQRSSVSAEGQTTEGQGQDPAQLTRGPSGTFSVTPTLDAHEAAVFALNDMQGSGAEATPGVSSTSPRASDRGAASRHIEEAQLRLALEISKAEAEGKTPNPETSRSEQPEGGEVNAGEEKAKSDEAEVTASAAEAPAAPQKTAIEFEGLPLRGEGGVPAAQVFIKAHCLAARVDSLPDALERSIESVVHKMVTPSSWTLLYESVTEELCLRARCAAHALCAAHARAIAQLEELAAGGSLGLDASERISLDQERMCLPIWRSSRVMSGLSRLAGETQAKQQLSKEQKAALHRARRGFLRQVALEWCELEDLTEFLDAQLGPLEMAIDNFRGTQEVNSAAHTPHVRDIGRLMFRNHCLLDCRVFRPLCLASYALVHEVHSVAEKEMADGETAPGAEEVGEDRVGLVELLEAFHEMLVACDVADDHLSASKHTKEPYEQHLVSPISAAVDRLADKDIRGHPSRDRAQRDGRKSGLRCV
eukprot:TRINITY_DN4868_c0_g1_i1.p1 TRINITY_DN4868_c0_g1~~TRINITY_DN4868_c0_g1_i1.p1  ORF type:complete len:769 (+),score=193.03 TRINITY_DN4868_c0_g1_i1:29-2308(+)